MFRYIQTVSILVVVKMKLHQVHMSSYELTGQFKNRGQRTGQREGGREKKIDRR